MSAVTTYSVTTYGAVAQAPSALFQVDGTRWVGAVTPVSAWKDATANVIFLVFALRVRVVLRSGDTPKLITLGHTAPWDEPTQRQSGLASKEVLLRQRFWVEAEQQVSGWRVSVLGLATGTEEG